MLSLHKIMKKVCILGYAQSLYQAPFHEEHTEFWIPNFCEVEKANLPRKPTRIFDIHPWDVIIAENQALPSGIHKLTNNTIPLYFIERTPTVPSSLKFPIDELTQMFFPWAKKIREGRYDDCYWTSSAQMMLALAIYEGFNEIELYGIDMADTVEYRNQRKGCEYIIGFAIGKGIKVRRPLSCPILRTKFIYGYDEIEERGYREWLKNRKDFMQTQLDQINRTGEMNAIAKLQIQGHLDEIDLMEKNWMDS